MYRQSILLLLLFLLVACKSDDTSDNKFEPVDATPAMRTAAEYCEAIGPMYCDFYMRCGRMHAADISECLSNFEQSCNAKYEPGYVGLGNAGFLRFDVRSVEACEAHLSDVACEQQVFELMGPCRALWEGQVIAGGSCGLGLEYFVCDAESECVISLDFCGTCYPVVALGELCTPGETSCGPSAFCQEGSCKARRKNGESCDDADRCYAGSACDSGLCTGPDFVELGDTCDRSHRCPYMTECIGGTCAQAVLHGEACSGEVPCGTGYCELGLCVPPQENGSTCSQSSQCASGQCIDMKCLARPSACLAQ
ncbi:MAG: hypothetical protein JKY56_13355 [Kofleriaceae bacterium]|nr:hypothetical protein [Kofleriaceae bacterium]